MSSTDFGTDELYEKTVSTLNSLQSGARTNKENKDITQRPNEEVMMKFLDRTGISPDDIDKLSVIHVTGTKGKGSTCAFCESIIRHHGNKTGFFSSPHLVEVRERIKINGKPLSRRKFNSYFWDCFTKLNNSRSLENDIMPAYFKFLTIMALHVFLQEKVDVAIIEVGIGGQYDSTNIFRKPIVCGVTSLGIDHIQTLGDTIEQIAWHKSGIFKNGAPAITVPQPAEGLKVLIQRSIELQSKLYMAPPMSDFDPTIELGIAGDIQRINASLALQLCKFWFEDHAKKYDEQNECHNDAKLKCDEHIMTLCQTFLLSEAYLDGLRFCKWPGRAQIIKQDQCTFYIDGAHTVDSLKQCAMWFKKVSDEEKSMIENTTLWFLLFNTTGERDSDGLLGELVSGDFDYAAFSPNITYSSAGNADQKNYNYTLSDMQNRTILNKNIWLQLLYDLQKNENDTIFNDFLHNELPNKASYFDCVSDAFAWILEKQKSYVEKSNQFTPALTEWPHIQILCTGSLHLIGALFNLIDPEMKSIC